MKIEKIELFRVKIPLEHFFETSYGRVYHEEHIIVKMLSEGITGYGESAVETVPYYIHETTDSVLYIQKEFFVPAVLHNEFRSIEELNSTLNKIRGNNIAKCGFEGAFWHIYTQMHDIPLYKQWGGVRSTIQSGISIGIQDSIQDLLKRIESFLDEGYKRIKIKIKPGWDVDAVKAIRENIGDIPLMVDANSAYTLMDVDILKALDDYNLMMIEQPLHHEDLTEHAHLQQHLQTPICLDESIANVASAKAALALQSCKIINVKPARVGGYSNAIEIHNLCKDSGVGIWCGGMLEFGIGRAFNVALCSLENFIFPGDVSSSSRYYKEDLISPHIELEQGEFKIPDNPGIGFGIDEEVLSKYTIDSFNAS